MSAPRIGATCTNCGGTNDVRRHGWRHGWCGACYRRWLRAGKPADGPPSPTFPARLEDYAWLRGQGLTRDEAAERLGIHTSTAARYEARQRQEAAA